MPKHSKSTSGSYGQMTWILDSPLKSILLQLSLWIVSFRSKFLKSPVWELCYFFFFFP
uniref:Uncharacterized protein n=1 Tax=Lepeophtheirus salmonis TaxID=72036 RepID=A0A0K2TZD6_LEPSM